MKISKFVTLVLLIITLALVGCAAVKGSSEGDLGPNKMRKSPCAKLLTLSRHV